MLPIQTLFLCILLNTFLLAAPNDDKQNNPAPQTILFLGNSLTAGYGLTPEEAYPAFIQQKIDSLQLPFKAVNAGLSGETSAGGLRRIDWLLRSPVRVLVLALGANDGLRGFPPEVTKANLQKIIDKTREKYPDCKIVIAGMEALPNMGEAYTKAFREIFPQLAEKNNALLIPFLLENVAGHPELNLGDGIHPNSRGQQIVAENVWQILAPLLQKLAERSSESD
jgi:acyl-CoA thioesterase-1